MAASQPCLEALEKKHSETVFRVPFGGVLATGHLGQVGSVYSVLKRSKRTRTVSRLEMKNFFKT